jgi:hypothetical protein
MEFDWKELVAVVASAFIGWLARHLELWLPPKRPKE